MKLQRSIAGLEPKRQKMPNRLLHSLIRKPFAIAPLLLILIAATTCAARNVDLSTVPKRDTVQLTIYNSEDLIRGTNIFRQVGQPGVQIDVNATVAGWDDHEIYSQRVRNYTSKPIELEMRRSFDGHVLFQSGLKPVLHDYRTVQFMASVDAGAKSDLLFQVLRHQGRNSKQHNVTVEDAEVAR
jgi:hypothetical protein